MKKKLVVLTGAGISAESGLKTFRDSDGLWEGYNVYEVATPQGFAKNPQLVLDFYNMRRRDVLQAQPNKAHITLASLEEFFDVTIITQNIDDLHERAGSTRVIHLHGQIFEMRSIKDTQTIYPIRGDIQVGDIAPDGYQLRPNIVWFEEPVPMIEVAAKLTAQAHLFAVIGTSLQVYPAAGLIDYTQPGIPTFLLDKQIPAPIKVTHFITIENTACNGIEALKEALLQYVH